MEASFEPYRPDMEAFHQQMKIDPCFVCDIVAGTNDLSQHFVYQDDRAVAFLDAYPSTKASLEKTQEALIRAEPTLLMCPQQSLHVSIAWLLAVHASYPVPKDILWACDADEWTTELCHIAAQSKGFRITYERLVATDSAVIALAEPVNRIRTMIRERLRLPSETRNEADPVHTTLFRYRGPLCDPEKFLTMLEDTSAEASAEVDELVISKELVYPSLESEVLARLPLAYL